MIERRLVLAAVLAAVALAGCGSSSGGSTASLSTFRSSFAAAQGKIREITAQTRAVVASARIESAAQLAPTFSALASRAEQEVGTLESLYPPPRYNTRLRALGSAMGTLASDVGNMPRQGRLPAAARQALLADASSVDAADQAVSASLR